MHAAVETKAKIKGKPRSRQGKKPTQNKSYPKGSPRRVRDSKDS